MISNKMKKRYTEEDYKSKCLELNKIYVKSQKERRGNKVHTIVYFICPYHKNKGVQNAIWGHFRTAKNGCPYCIGRYKTTEDIIPLIKDKNVEIISKYKGCEKPIICRCKICGNIWTTVPKVLTSNGSGCPICGKIKANKAESKSQKQFEDDLYKVNPNITIIGEYKNTHTKIKCRCNIDGYEWYGYPANLLNRSAGCPKCNMSIGESMLLNILDRLKIPHISQYKIKDCKYVDTLKFDAFSPQHNIAFEYNGEQHYYPVDFAGKGNEWANENLKLIQSRNNAKIEYCKTQNIPIIIIPYWEKDNMECFLIKKIKELQEVNIN